MHCRVRFCRQFVTLSETGAGDKLTVLAQLGITTDQKTGALNFDSTKFSAAMNDKKLGGEVQKMFVGDSGSDNGLLGACRKRFHLFRYRWCP
jgi:flagellar hook-associated protein 2